MKTISILFITLFSGLLFSPSAFSQSLHLIDDSGNGVSNITIQDTIPCDNSGGQFEPLAKLYVDNLTNQSIDVKVKRLETSFISGSDTYLQWYVGYGNILAGTQYEFPVQGTPEGNHHVSVAPGTSSLFIGLNLVSNGFCGESCYTIVAYDGNNPNDSVWVNTCLYLDSTITSVGNIDELELKVYPTIAANTIHFETSNPIQGSLLIWDSAGKLTDQMSIDGNKTQVNLLAYSNGLYFYSLQSRSGTKRGKFIVRRH